MGIQKRRRWHRQRGAVGLTEGRSRAYQGSRLGRERWRRGWRLVGRSRRRGCRRRRGAVISPRPLVVRHRYGRRVQPWIGDRVARRQRREVSRRRAMIRIGGRARLTQNIADQWGQHGHAADQHGQTDHESHGLNTACHGTGRLHGQLCHPLSASGPRIDHEIDSALSSGRPPAGMTGRARRASPAGMSRPPVGYDAGCIPRAEAGAPAVAARCWSHSTIGAAM
jgi:hypothetical protein